MAQQNRTILKTYFETGDVPTEAQFIHLIDSFYNFVDNVSTGSKSSAVDAGTFADISIDDDYLYICIETGGAGSATWKKIPLLVSS